jgi:uncharacterized membrane protein
MMEVFEMNGPWQGGPPGYVHHDAWWGLTHVLPFLMFLALLGVAIWAVLRFTSHPLAAGASGAARAPVDTASVAATARDPAMEELRIRYARGDLGRDDFSQRMRDLGYPDIGTPQTAAVADDVTPPVEGDAVAESDAPAEDG